MEEMSTSQAHMQIDKSCPAQGKTCSYCQKKNHLLKVCKSRKQSAFLHAAEISGSHGSLAAAQDDIWDLPDHPDNSGVMEELGSPGNLTFFSIRSSYDSQQFMPAVTTVPTHPVQLKVHKASLSRTGGIILGGYCYQPNNKANISNQVTQTHLSRDCCEQLQTFPQNFPSIGGCPPATIAGATATAPTTSPASSNREVQNTPPAWSNVAQTLGCQHWQISHHLLNALITR